MIRRTVLEKLYCRSKLSVAECATQLGETFPKTLYWIRKHRIPIRSYSERAYVKINRGGEDPFHPKIRLSARERDLFLCGLMLYWGEGSRKSPFGIQLANLDHQMLKVFLEFLRQVARFDESRIRLDVRLYRDFDKAAAKRFWCKTLSLPAGQVFVYYHNDPRSRVDKQWSPYGIATIGVYNTKFKMWMDQQLEQHIQRLLSRWSMTETQTHHHGIVSDKVGTYTYDTTTNSP